MAPVHVSRRVVRKFLWTGCVSGQPCPELGRGRIDVVKSLERTVHASGTRWYVMHTSSSALRRVGWCGQVSRMYVSACAIIVWLEGRISSCSTGRNMAHTVYVGMGHSHTIHPLPVSGGYLRVLLRRNGRPRRRPSQFGRAPQSNEHKDQPRRGYARRGARPLWLRKSFGPCS